MILREQRNLQGLKFNVNNVPYFEINVALFKRHPPIIAAPQSFSVK